MRPHRICMKPQLMQKETTDLKESKDRYMGEFSEKKGKGRCFNYITIEKKIKISNPKSNNSKATTHF